MVNQHSVIRFIGASCEIWVCQLWWWPLGKVGNRRLEYRSLLHLSSVWHRYQVYILDEIQDVDGWHLFVNRLLRSNLHLVVTGSNAKLLSGELATHLTGRYNEIHLFPFSFYEYCMFHHVDLAGITTKADAERKRAFLGYIADGGFPEMQTCATSVAMYKAWWKPSLPRIYSVVSTYATLMLCER